MLGERVKLKRKVPLRALYYPTVLVFTKKRMFTLVSVANGEYLPRCLAAWEMSTTGHLHFHE